MLTFARWVLWVAATLGSFVLAIGVGETYGGYDFAYGPAFLAGLASFVSMLFFIAVLDGLEEIRDLLRED